MPEELQHRLGDLQAFMSLTFSFFYATTIEHSCVENYLFAKAKRKTQGP
jgi:hypothetical protein